jgi:preprotein translocase subunit SecG
MIGTTSRKLWPKRLAEATTSEILAACGRRSNRAGYPVRRRTIERIRTAMMAFAYTLIALLVLTSVLLTLLILLHRGKGGGLSSMFGGGVSSSLGGSSIAEKNLDRYTVLVGIVWFACIVGLGLWLKLAQNGAS